MERFRRNFGPKSTEMLAKAGITTDAQLIDLGTIAAFLAVKRAGCSPSLNFLWAIEGALSGRDWKVVAKEDRLRLLMQLEDAEKHRG
jgi:DNA transformation protein and related proteins